MNNKQIKLFKKQKEMYKSLTDEQQEVIETYFSDEMRKLKKICNPILFRKNVPQMYYEDLYAVASDTLIESLKSFDGSKSSFSTFLIGNINRSFYDWTRDNTTRLCRNNIETDKNGKIIRDENGKVSIIPNVSLDAPIEDGIDLRERVASDFNIEDKLLEEMEVLQGDKISKYMKRLSNRQRKIVLLLSDGYTKEEIAKLLHINRKKLNEDMSSIMAYENIRILL